MLQRCVLALLLATAQAADAKERALSQTDIAEITRICRNTISDPVAHDRKLWSQLTPFLRIKSEPDHLIVDCSSQHCSGSIRLRDDAQMLYIFVHVRWSTAKLALATSHQTSNTKETAGSSV